MMKFYFAVFLTFLMAVSSTSSFAQTKKKSAKAKAKTTTSKKVTEPVPVPVVEKPVESTEATETATQAEDFPAAEAPVAIEPLAPTATPPAAPAANQETTLQGGHKFGLQAALGVPHPIRAGLVYVLPSQLFSFEGNFGAFSLATEGASVKMSNMELGLRWHPFLGAFYLGALIGNRTITAEKTEVISSQDVLAKVEIKSNYLAPNIGWMWGADDGGFFGSVDFGMVLPSGASASLSTNADAAVQATPDYQTLDTEVRDIGKKLGEIPLPMFTLIKLGYLF